jgi:hypothetical protein
MEDKHGKLSDGLMASVDKLKLIFKTYEIMYPTFDKTTEIIYWAERHSEIKEVEVKIKYLADHFWSGDGV